MDLTNYNEIRALLARHGFRFSKSLGQNFLTAAWVPARIADEAGLDERTGVVEIGPGVGCLTAELSKRAGKVVSIELDRALRPVLAETLADCENVEVVFGDACKMDLAALVREKLPGLRPVVCANLPYNVTSPLLTAILEAGCFETVTVMIQREVARRLCAEPGSADYGAFGLFVQWHCAPELLFDVPPSCFVRSPRSRTSSFAFSFASPMRVAGSLFISRASSCETIAIFTSPSGLIMLLYLSSVKMSVIAVASLIRSSRCLSLMC